MMFPDCAGSEWSAVERSGGQSRAVEGSEGSEGSEAVERSGAKRSGAQWRQAQWSALGQCADLFRFIIRKQSK